MSRYHWTMALKEAKQERQSATKLGEINAVAARKLQGAKADLKRLDQEPLEWHRRPWSRFFFVDLETGKLEVFDHLLARSARSLGRRDFFLANLLIFGSRYRKSRLLLS
jgi:hypothetical protein